MSIRCEEYEGVCVVTVDGDLSGETVVEAQRAVDEAIAREQDCGFVFDLEECDFVDSAGLEMLLSVRRRCEELGAGVTLARVGTVCAKILEITRLGSRFESHADLSHALAATR